MKKQLGIGLLIAAVASAGLIGSAVAQDQEQELTNDEASLEQLIMEGEGVFSANCASCHGAEGQGGAGPALADNDFVESRSAVINQILFGAVEHGMPPFAPVLDDREIAAVATYIRNSWENEYSIVLPRSVELRRAHGPEEEEE